jgi:hypothetical protein
VHFGLKSVREDGLGASMSTVKALQVLSTNKSQKPSQSGRMDRLRTPKIELGAWLLTGMRNAKVDLVGPVSETGGDSAALEHVSIRRGCPSRLQEACSLREHCRFA